jgi:hypothetical protein
LLARLQQLYRLFAQHEATGRSLPEIQAIYEASPRFGGRMHSDTDGVAEWPGHRKPGFSLKSSEELCYPNAPEVPRRSLSTRSVIEVTRPANATPAGQRNRGARVDEQ